MDLFVSKYINKIDKKGRVSLPSSFRNVLPKSNRNEIILYKSIKSPSIEGCGVGRLKEIAKRINNFRPFILTGFSTDFNLSSNEKNSDDNASNVFRTTSQSFNYELGLGFEFYLYYFKFSPSFRGIFSFQNELISDNRENSPWTGKILNMLSRGDSLIINFE